MQYEPVSISAVMQDMPPTADELGPNVDVCMWAGVYEYTAT